MQILSKFKYYLTKNKLTILSSVIISLLIFLIINAMDYFKIIPKFSILPLNVAGWGGGHNVSFMVDGSIGIVLALVLLICKKRFNSFEEIGILSFWSSLFLAIALLFTIDILLFYLVGIFQMIGRLTALISADLLGLLFFTLAFTVISILINGVYFKIRK